MLSPQIVTIATDRIRLDFLGAHNAFAQRVSTIYSELTAKGMLHSGRMPLLVNTAIREEASARAMGAWQVIARVLSTAPGGLTSTTPEELKGLVDSAMAAGVADLQTQFDSAVKLVGRTLESFDSLIRPAIARAHSEIDISFLSTANATPAGQTINIYQSYGIVQTGHGSTASFNLSVDEVRQVTEALDEVATALSASPTLHSTDRTQALELVADARQELARPSPNRLRLQGALSGLATTIQTLGSAAAAYQVLKHAAALVGVALP